MTLTTLIRRPKNVRFRHAAHLAAYIVCWSSDLCAAELGRFDGHPSAPRVSKRGGLVVSNGELYAKSWSRPLLRRAFQRYDR